MNHALAPLFVGGLCGLIVSTATDSVAAVQAVSLADPSAPRAAGGNSDSSASVISADGRFVLFLSDASNLVTNDTNGKFVDVFLRNRTNGATALVSVNLTGTGGGNGHSISPAISVDGRYVAFESEANNLVATDTNGVSDVFVRDLQNGTTTLVSANIAATGAGNDASTSPVISADGRYVTFVSAASDLAASDTNGVSDVFLRDLQNGTTLLVSVSPDGVHGGDGDSDSPVMTPDAHWVAFVSRATNLVQGVTNSQGEIYARDLVSGATVWVSTNALPILFTLAPTNNYRILSYNAVISADGKVVVFKTSDSRYPVTLLLRHHLDTGTTDLISTNAMGNTIGISDASGPDMTPDGRFIAYTAWAGTPPLAGSAVYLWDAETGTNILISADLSGQASPDAFSDTPAVSADGRFVAFVSDATGLVTNAVDGSYQVYLRDVSSGTTKLVSADASGGVTGEASGAIPTISADGRYVAFDSFDADYVANDSNNALDVFVRDTTTDTTELMSRAEAAAQSLTANGLSSVSANSVSADGRFVAFESMADNLVADDTNSSQDVFVRDLDRGSNILVSVNQAGTGAASGFSGDPAISANGRYVAFVSSAPDLTANKTNAMVEDIFARDLQARTTTLVSVSADGTTSGSAASSSPAISSDGRYVTFYSLAKNLVANDLARGGEIFWRDLQTGNTVSVSPEGAGGPLASMSADGRYVAFVSRFQLRVWDSQSRSNVVTIGSGTPPLAFVYTLSPDGRWLIYQSSTNSNRELNRELVAYDLPAGSSVVIGQTATFGLPTLQISGNGRFVAFVGRSQPPGSQLVTNNLFLYDLQTGTRALVSLNRDRSGAGNGPSDSPSISADGRFVAYRSSASDLVADDSNGQPDVFVFDRLSGSNTLVSVNQTGASSGNERSSSPVISADGSTIVFRSLASDLVAGDRNNTLDVFFSRAPSFGFVDSDGDGMNDAWEKAYFGDLSHNGLDDSDDDGVSDFMEYETGTNPTDAASRFSAEAALLTGGNPIVIRWTATPGWSYRVQYKNDLSEADWHDLPGVVMVDGLRASRADDTATTSNQRFYRVTLVP